LKRLNFCTEIQIFEIGFFRSESTIFSDQALEDDDSPVIRGFSDDEPLVIA
jgi:hypothetical protein